MKGFLITIYQDNVLTEFRIMDSFEEANNYLVNTKQLCLDYTSYYNPPYFAKYCNHIPYNISYAYSNNSGSTVSIPTYSHTITIFALVVMIQDDRDMMKAMIETLVQEK